jgi:predicted nucleic acid-binding Zn ribbon protein
MDHREEHAHIDPPAAAEPPAAERSDDDVLQVIADVEQRLATIRDMQQSSNEQLVSLEDRARSLSEK